KPTRHCVPLAQASRTAGMFASSRGGSRLSQSPQGAGFPRFRQRRTQAAQYRARPASPAQRHQRFSFPL
ncbi:hypothetical protein, partial [Bilophila sp. 4_1_30]|uniref:hypothetical protein n=1 Tax=Bilophila sp. 4_1_30 TaxID=693988 RepID=UPI001E42DF69